MLNIKAIKQKIQQQQPPPTPTQTNNNNNNLKKMVNGPTLLKRKRITTKKSPSSSRVERDHSIFVWSPQKKCVCAKLNPLAERSRLLPLKGVNPTCRHLFYPKYKFSYATCVTNGTKNSQQLKQEGAHQSKRKNAYGKKDTSIAHKNPLVRRKKAKTKGLRVERQIQQTMEWFHKLNCPPQTFWVPTVRCRIAKTITDTKERERFNKCCRNLESYTEKFWGIMWKYSLIPTQAQVRCGDIEMGEGTKMDFKCQDALNPTRKIGIELKINYSYKNECTPNMMNAPFQFLTDCPLNQHYLYLLNTWILHDLTYPDEKLHDYWLIRIDENGVDINNIPNSILAQRQAMISKIKQNKSQPQPQQQPRQQTKQYEIAG